MEQLLYFIQGLYEPICLSHVIHRHTNDIPLIPEIIPINDRPIEAEIAIQNGTQAKENISISLSMDFGSRP
jgi:hypothetical protein